MYQQNRSSESEVKFRRASIVGKGFLNLPNLYMLLKQKSPSRIVNSFVNKGKSVIPPLFNGPEVLSSASDKAKLFAKNFSKNYNLDDSGTSLSVFPSRINVKLQYFHNSQDG